MVAESADFLIQNSLGRYHTRDRIKDRIPLDYLSRLGPYAHRSSHLIGKPASIPESAFSAPALTNGHCHDKRSGGVLVHKAASRKQKDEYLWKCQQLMIPSSSSDIIENADSFQQEMFQLYGQTGRRTKKRRTMDSRQTLSTKPIIPKPMPSEHDEPMLEYLNTVGEAAYLRMRVDLQHGQGKFAFRQLGLQTAARQIILTVHE